MSHHTYTSYALERRSGDGGSVHLFASLADVRAFIFKVWPDHLDTIMADLRLFQCAYWTRTVSDQPHSRRTFTIETTLLLRKETKQYVTRYRKIINQRYVVHDPETWVDEFDALAQESA